MKAPVVKPGNFAKNGYKNPLTKPMNNNKRAHRNALRIAGKERFLTLLDLPC